MWTFHSYVIGATDVVSEWYALYSAAIHLPLRAKLDVRMNYLRDQPVWPDPLYHPLAGQEGLGAVRFKVKNVQYRPMGFFGPGNRTFTFVYFATEKGDKYLPKNCFEEAKARMKHVKKSPSAAVLIDRWTHAR